MNYQPKTPRRRKQKTIIIYLLFLIIDEFPHEKIWRFWCNSATYTEIEFRILFHAKNENLVSSEWVKSHQIFRNEQFPAPKWGSIELTKTMYLLLSSAVNDSYSSPQKTYFVFLSESCIPIMRVNEFARQIRDMNAPDHSWMKLFNTPNGNYAKKYQFEPLIKKGIPENCIIKTDQWIFLSKKHAEVIIQFVNQNTKIWDIFKNIHASDEMFFSTVLAIIYGGYNNLKFKEITERRITYVDWSEYKSSPKTHTYLTRELIQKAHRDFGSPFFRKLKLSRNGDYEKQKMFYDWYLLIYS